MFYVPDQDHSPSNKRSSLRLIQKFTELYAKMNPQRSQSHKRRFKTVEFEEKPKRNSLPCKPKQSILSLPAIQEKRFLLKGSEIHSKHHEHHCSLQPIETARRQTHQKRLSNFKKTQKQANREKIARKMRQSIENMGVHLQPWITSEDSNAF